MTKCNIHLVINFKILSLNIYLTIEFDIQIFMSLQKL